MNERVAALRKRFVNDEHLDFESELVPYVEGRLNGEDKRAVEAHLANCATCRAETGDLRGFAAKERRVRPLFMAAVAAAAAIVIGFIVLVPRTTLEPQATRFVHAQLLTVALRDGNNVIGIDRSGALHGISLDAKEAKRVASLLANPALGLPPVLSSLAAPPRSLRGSAPARSDLTVVSPRGVAVVATRPKFVWLAPPNVSVQVTITDGTHEWTANEDLPRDRTYTWQIAATIDGKRVVAPAPPEPIARFRVVDQKTADAIANAHSHLIAGTLAYDAGAIDDARHEFEQLAKENPASPIPQQLIASCSLSSGGQAPSPVPNR